MSFADFFKKKTDVQKATTHDTHDAEMVADPRRIKTPANLGATQPFVPFGSQGFSRKSLDQLKSRLYPNDRLHYYNNGNYFVTVNEPERESPPTEQDYQAVFGSGFKKFINRSESVALLWAEFEKLLG